MQLYHRIIDNKEQFIKNWYLLYNNQQQTFLHTILDLFATQIAHFSEHGSIKIR